MADKGKAIDWQAMSDTEVEQHFNPRVACPDAASHLEYFIAESAAARKRQDMRRNIAYGDHPREVYDIFPGPVGSPMHIFIHGGYWRALSKDEHSFVAEPFASAGATVVLINYPLCPEVTLDGLADSVMRGIAHAASHASDYGASSDGVHISGHSAGAHLSAIAAAHDWTAHGLPADLIRSAALLSGIFDPRAALRISINAEIGLTDEVAARNNILTDAFAPRAGIDLLVAAGGDEPDGWIGQSTGYAAMHGVTRDVILVAGRNHFTLMEEVADAKSPLTRAMLSMMGL
ncbi:MAG: alpha/beta hydrolase [Minwuia sp.]|nr:alpha/beta hydrolase [Minwuia sp.]